MSDEIINFDMMQVKPASIKVIGVGGGGGNAVNHMYDTGIKDVDFVLCNTDAQALAASPVPVKIHIGEHTTHGRGAGNKPEVGREAAIEAIGEIEKVLSDNTQMVFITAGMGGGTGTGAAPIIAKTAKEMGILTVAIVTVPFRFEGKHRIEQAFKGVEELKNNVDSLLVINNEKLRQMYGNLALSDAFRKADDVLAVAAKGIAEIITVSGKVNVDFADVNTVMANSGVAIMGSGTASGENRAIDAITQALNSPLLNNAEIKGANNILLNFSSGDVEITMDEMTDITEYIIDQTGVSANMIWGSVTDKTLRDELRVTIIATGFEMSNLPDFSTPKNIVQEKITLETPKVAEKIVVKEEIVSESKPSEIIDEIVLDPVSKIVEEDFHDREITLINSSTQVRPKSESQKSNTTTLLTDDGKESFKWDMVKAKDDITAWEKIPAFKRKQMQLNLDFEDSDQNDDGKEVSRYTLSGNSGKVRLSENNAFLDDNVD